MAAIPNSKEKELLFKTIGDLKTILIILVVLIHCYITSISKSGEIIYINRATYPVFWYVSTFLSNILASVAVPTFFLFSGFLFFYNISFFNYEAYKKKIKRRLKTLFVPYVCWNLIALGFLTIGGLLIPSMLPEKIKSITNWSIIDWLGVFWNFRGDGTPADYPLWFIRDLLVVVLFTPIIFVFIKKVKIAFIIILTIIWILYYDVHITGFSRTALYFFTIGAYCGIRKLNFVNNVSRLSSNRFLIFILLILYVVSTIAILRFSFIYNCDYIRNMNVLLGIFLLICFYTLVIQRFDVCLPLILKESTFFIYAAHGILLKPIQSLLQISMGDISETKLFVIYGLKLGGGNSNMYSIVLYHK